MPFEKRLGASKREGLSSTPSRTGPEAAAQTFIVGAVLVNSSGRLAKGGTDPTAIVGVSESDATGTTDKDIRYVPAAPHILFEAYIGNSGAGSEAIEQADLFAEYGITEDGDGNWYIDKDKSGATGRFKVLEFVDAVGTTNGRVRGVFTYDATFYAAS